MTAADVVARATDWVADAKVAHAYGVGVRADLSTIGMVSDLLAEVEQLRSSVAALQTRQMMLRDTLDEVRRACEDALP